MKPVAPLIPAVGEEWIYRLRDDAPSQRVRILTVQEGKKSRRVDVEFCDGPNAGVQENVPALRLRGLWSTVAEYDTLMANWDHLGEFDLTEAEQAAVETVYGLLIPEEIAEWLWKPVRFATAIHDPAALENLIGVPIAEIASRVASFDLGGVTMLSGEGTLVIAEYACRVSPVPVLDAVTEEEKKRREASRRGGRVRSVSGRVDYDTSPELEYEHYRRYYRPVHELLRQWCGHRAITLHERLAAAEAENHRLDVLIDRMIDTLADSGAIHAARALAQEHQEERITPENIRPVVERPLHPSEVPVRYERYRRRWG